MSDTAKIAKNLQAFRIAVNAHDRNHPEPHPAAYGIGLSGFDMERLGFEDGEELWPPITIHTVECGSGTFRVLCGGEHDEADQERADGAVGSRYDKTGAYA